MWNIFHIVLSFFPYFTVICVSATPHMGTRRLLKWKAYQYIYEVINLSSKSMWPGKTVLEVAHPFGFVISSFPPFFSNQLCLIVIPCIFNFIFVLSLFHEFIIRQIIGEDGTADTHPLLRRMAEPTSCFIKGLGLFQHRTAVGAVRWDMLVWTTFLFVVTFRVVIFYHNFSEMMNHFLTIK